MRNLLSKSILNFLVLFILTLLLIFGLWGLKPTIAVTTTQVSYYRLTPFKKGLALYQQDQPYFYNFSPYNDYLVDQKRSYHSLITKKDIMEGKFEADINQKPIKKKLSFLLSLFGLYQPEVVFKSGSQKIHYSSEINENTVKIKRQIDDFPSVNKAQALGITISFDDQDFVFDQNFRLYTSNSDDDLQAIEKYYGLRLVPIRESEKEYVLWTEIPSKNVFIINPNLPGIIQIKALSNQKIMFNKTYQLVAIQENGDFNKEGVENFIVVKLLNNIEEILEQ